ncbi:hypothetical protein P153DRAFT_124358 [Dothidotthia symphoricarpi CBS 119687]|uniref:Uncharacterized protein n=1 Tax=Dothidotthia symphoricarpi CBS 119687 TaxID=1392245 RepID=A0A6A6A1S3_9PLEO|nr:uncharacterized protein P153DRAFT_124358 [Dothidotthia symphoricarpi CBS 119687]KAF2124668.1 hypothetical protein P153DRAFT_124358 [Dothidotthia symphoricarpi CBS 119687]
MRCGHGAGGSASAVQLCLPTASLSREPTLFFTEQIITTGWYVCDEGFRETHLSRTYFRTSWLTATAISTSCGCGVGTMGSGTDAYTGGCVRG